MFPVLSNRTKALPSPHCRPLTGFTGTIQTQLNITESIHHISGTTFLMTIFTAVNFHSQLLLRTDLLVTAPPFRVSSTNHAGTHVASHTALMGTTENRKNLLWEYTSCKPFHFFKPSFLTWGFTDKVLRLSERFWSISTWLPHIYSKPRVSMTVHQYNTEWEPTQYLCSSLS